jgi:predicted alpha/beta-hydrolase family hydrolase
MLFVQGSHDAFGTADEIRALLPYLPHASLREVPGGDHSFHVSGRGIDQASVLASIIDAVVAWMRGSHGNP